MTSIRPFKHSMRWSTGDPRCVEVVTRIFDWRMRSLDETGEISTDESERLTTNCDRFLAQAGRYLQAQGDAGKSDTSAIVNHVARFLLERETMGRDDSLTQVAEILGLCFAGSLADLRTACEVIREQQKS